MNNPLSTQNNQTALIAHVAALRENEALAMVRERLANGGNPLGIIEDCQEGLRRVGLLYEQREYYLAGLIMAGEIFRGVMEIVQPVIEEQIHGSSSGSILLGTVAGDIHDIGKNNLSMLLTCYGFTVHDLGVDVAPADFLAHARRLQPDIIGLSGLLTSSYEAMKTTVELVRIAGETAVSSIPILLGGNQLNQQVCDYIGGDFWVNDAMTGVRLCQQLLKA